MSVLSLWVTKEHKVTRVSFLELFDCFLFKNIASLWTWWHKNKSNSLPSQFPFYWGWTKADLDFSKWSERRLGIKIALTSCIKCEQKNTKSLLMSVTCCLLKTNIMPLAPKVVIVLGWPKSSFGFFRKLLWTNFLANPMRTLWVVLLQE